MCIVAILYGMPAAASLFMCFPCAGRPLCHPCDFVPVLTSVLPIFSKMCPYSLLVGANVTLEGDHLLRPQHKHAMSATPFYGLICFHILMCMHPLFFFALCCLPWTFNWNPPHFFLIYTHWCCCHQHLSIPNNLLFWCIRHVLLRFPWWLSSHPCQSASHFVVASLSWPLVPCRLMGEGGRGATAFLLARHFCCSHPHNCTIIHTATGVCMDETFVFFKEFKLCSGLFDGGF